MRSEESAPATSIPPVEKPAALVASLAVKPLAASKVTPSKTRSRS